MEQRARELQLRHGSFLYLMWPHGNRAITGKLQPGEAVGRDMPPSLAHLRLMKLFFGDDLAVWVSNSRKELQMLARVCEKG
jgi:hypothetical protein